jgi:uncharacterized protein YdeI (YjbR/CyaY-like superfamily)
VSHDPRVDEYIAKAQPFAREILGHVRERIHAVLPDVAEDIKWRMPAYLAGGKLVLITAAFKGHAELKFWRGQEMSGGGEGAKLTSPADLPSDDRLDQLIREAAELAKTAPASRTASQASKEPPQMHPDFAQVLGETPKAKAVFDGFPPSAQRDYLEWITEAKQDSTRQKRIATAVEWLSEGKRRNWKYEK